MSAERVSAATVAEFEVSRVAEILQDINCPDDAASLFAIHQASRSGRFDDLQADIASIDRYLAEHPKQVVIEHAELGRLIVSGVAIVAKESDELHADVRLLAKEKPDSVSQRIYPSEQNTVRVSVDAIAETDVVLSRLR